MEINEKMNFYLQDSFLLSLYNEIREAGPLRSITVDITHACNLRCKGCYFFEEDMNQHSSPKEDFEFDRFIEKEKARGTNFITVLGGEPAIVPGRLKKLYDNFQILTFTNGYKLIPYGGFEDMTIALSLWGDHELDKELRGNGKKDVFSQSLKNYKDDPRVIWYYTTTPGRHYEIEHVTEKCINNGNFLQFSYYEDRSGLGGDLCHESGFENVRIEIDKMIDRYPDRIITTSYVNKVATSNSLFDQKWGYDVCPTISRDSSKNEKRLRNEFPFVKHFNAYYPDLESIRRCCIGEDHDCSVCYNNWARITWIVINKKLHMNTLQDFTNWLTTLYVMYLFSGSINLKENTKKLVAIHKRLSSDFKEVDVNQGELKIDKYIYNQPGQHP